MIRLSPSLVLDDSLFEERFVRASGPGGQNVNKVSTAVELRVRVEDLPLTPDAKDRLRALSGARLTADGLLIVEAREHRTQLQNREEARGRLATLVRRALVRPRPRRATRPTAAAKARRLQTKTLRSRVKAGRRVKGDGDG